jgi:hypothetical protein
VPGKAHAVMRALTLSERLFVQDFNFSIPSTATILAVAVALNVSTDEPLANNTGEEEIALIARDRGTPGSPFTLWTTSIPTNRTGWMATPGSIITYPISDDDALWGGAVSTGVDVSSPGFGVSLRIRNVDLFDVPANVWCVSMTVTYLVVPTPFATTENAPPDDDLPLLRTSGASTETYIIYATAFGGLGCLFAVPFCAWVVTRVRDYRSERANKRARRCPDTQNLSISLPRNPRRGRDVLTHPPAQARDAVMPDDESYESCGFTSSSEN